MEKKKKKIRTDGQTDGQTDGWTEGREKERKTSETANEIRIQRISKLANRNKYLLQSGIA